MGLCASMLRRKPKNRHPEPRRGTPKALFVVRNDRRPSNPQALVVQARNPGGSGFQNPGKAQETSRKHEKCSYDCTDVLGRRLCVPRPRLPCGSTRSVAVQPVAPGWRESGATTERSAARSVAVASGWRESGATTERSAAKSVAVAPGWRESGATTERSAVEGCRTPRRTPVWQRRILMGTRCELPRFSGLILYDEHGRPLQSNTQNRADHRVSRPRKSESNVMHNYKPEGKKKTARTTTTLRDLM